GAGGHGVVVDNGDGPTAGAGAARRVAAGPHRGRALAHRAAALGPRAVPRRPGLHGVRQVQHPAGEDPGQRGRIPPRRPVPATVHRGSRTGDPRQDRQGTRRPLQAGPRRGRGQVRPAVEVGTEGELAMSPRVLEAGTEEYLRKVREGIRQGRFPVRAFNDQEIYDLEQERLFSRAWCFLAHESEIPAPGDYVLRYIGNNSIIVARDEHGVVHANLNMCRHRGNQMCKAEMGNASHFRCSYHGRGYKNSGELVGVPYMKEGYEGRLDRKDWSLVRVRTDTYGGLIFGCLDPQAPSLADYLGDFTFYLDFYLKQSEDGVEVYGPPDHWIAD